MQQRGRDSSDGADGSNTRARRHSLTKSARSRSHKKSASATGERGALHAWPDGGAQGATRFELHDAPSPYVGSGAWMHDEARGLGSLPLAWRGSRGFHAPQALDGHRVPEIEGEPEVALVPFKLYQERQRTLMADLLLAEEHERRRLAVDLHDGLSQTIALARMKLAALRNTTDPTLARSLNEIERLIDEANQSARSLTFELSPAVLHDIGLEPAVQWLVENIQSRYGIEIVLEDDDQPKAADQNTRVILFRSIRELLINAAKHACARCVRVRLERMQDQLSATVADDGVGMDTTRLQFKGTGLYSIRERLNHVGGSMRIESARGCGTKITMCAPVAKSESQKTGVPA